MGSVQPPKWSHNFLTSITKLQSHSSSLRPVPKVFTCWKWFIGYNFGIDDRTESNFGTHEELIVLNILKYKCCVNNSSDLSRDHFAKICKLLTNWWPVFSKSGVRILYLVHVLYPVRSPGTAVRSPQSMFYTAWFCIRRSPKYPCRVLFAINWLQHKDNAIWCMLIWCMLNKLTSKVVYLGCISAPLYWR